MATIGKFGSTIKFSVSSDKVLTFNNLKRTASGRWAKHNIIGAKPKSEFQGAESGSVTMDVNLSAEHGVKPRTMADKIIKASEKGTLEYLIVGGKKVCKKKCYIQSVSDLWNVVMNKGELVSASLTLTFSEY